MANRKRTPGEEGSALRTTFEKVRCLEEMTPLEKISGCVYDMEQPLADAIAIARTAQERGWDEEDGDEDMDYGAVLTLLLYRLDQLAESHRLLMHHAPPYWRAEKARQA